MRLQLVAMVMAIVVVAGCSSGDSEGDSSDYTIVEETETGIGTEVVVSVEDNADSDAAFNEVLNDHDGYASVTIICAGDDVRQDGYILYGRADGDDRDVVSRDQDRDC